MDVKYRNRKIEQICTNASNAEKKYGVEMAGKIHQRIDELKAVDTVEEMIRYGIGQCHSLKGNRKGQYAVDLVQPQRLVFEVNNGIVKIALISEIIDYH